MTKDLTMADQQMGTTNERWRILETLTWQKHPDYIGVYNVFRMRDSEQVARVYDHGTFWGIRLYQNGRVIERTAINTTNLDEVKREVGRLINR